MKKRAYALTSLLASTLLVSACSDPASGGGSSAGAALTAIADRFDSCGFDIAFDETERANADLTAALPGYDASLLTSCVAEVNAAACGSLPACLTSAGKGTRALGKSCITPNQCASGACSSDGTTCGQCIAAPACTKSSECNSNELCESGVCKAQPPVAAGGACGQAGMSCANGLMCNQVSKKCEKQPALGESCTSPLCAAGAYCDTTTTHKCVALPVANAACAFDTLCAKGLLCDAKVCRAPKANLAAGTACAAGDSCTAGFCSRAKKCVTYPAEGATAVDGTCAPGLTPDASEKCVKNNAATACTW